MNKAARLEREIANLEALAEGYGRIGAMDRRMQVRRSIRHLKEELSKALDLERG